MRPVAIHGPLTLIGLLFALAGCGGGSPGEPPPPPAPVSTLAYIVTRCHEGKAGTGASFSQALWVRHQDGAPVKIVEFALGQPPIGGLCRLLGQYRNGTGSTPAGAFQRLGVSPDGSLVVFEVTDDFSILTHVVPEEQQGIFVVRPDGTGLHKVAAHSQDPCFRIYWSCVFAQGPPVCSFCSPFSGSTFFAFSRDGGRVTYTDLGPSDTGHEASQVFTLDLTTGESLQATHLPPQPVSPACVGSDADCLYTSTLPFSTVAFLGDTTIGFERGRGCAAAAGGVFTVTVTADRTEEPRAVDTVAAGGDVLPVFQITGEPYATTAVVEGIPQNGSATTINEVFVIEPPDTAQLPEARVLQLTNYRRFDTGFPRLSADRQRVFFIASADPLDRNSAHQCQVFSVDRLGGNLRQLTFFRATGDRGRDCGDTTFPGGCTMVGVPGVDLITGSLVFRSTCDPLGRNQNGGEQAFAIRPDGGGLVQLTETQGMTRNADGSIDVELPGPFRAAAYFR